MLTGAHTPGEVVSSWRSQLCLLLAVIFTLCPEFATDIGPWLCFNFSKVLGTVFPKIFVISSHFIIK